MAQVGRGLGTLCLRRRRVGGTPGSRRSLGVRPQRHQTALPGLGLPPASGLWLPYRFRVTEVLVRWSRRCRRGSPTSSPLFQMV